MVLLLLLRQLAVHLRSDRRNGEGRDESEHAAYRLIATLIQTVILNLLFEIRLALAQCDHVTFEQGLILNALRAFKARILTRWSLLLLAWIGASIRQLGPIRDPVFAL
jgi:hypothetical protein